MNNFKDENDCKVEETKEQAENTSVDNAGVDGERRDFVKLVGVGCGVACACYAGYKAVSYMAPSADSMAEATVEVNIANLKEGETMKVKWRGKPIFVKKRTPEEIKEAEDVKLDDLRDPQTDDSRVLKGHKEILVVVGICTHLGCVPINADDGWFCPCHGSHYDTSGRIRKGPAPKNLEVPMYRFASETVIVIGEKGNTVVAELEKTFLM
jgi:ubiquinol-cytochrome c reductase iron-sulfur subunit